MALESEKFYCGFPFFEKTNNSWNFFKTVSGKCKVQIMCKAAEVDNSEYSPCSQNFVGNYTLLF
jgi:hypothetical protein